MKHPVGRGLACTSLSRNAARHLFALSALTVCLSMAYGKASAAPPSCAANTSVLTSCGDLVINGQNQTITIDKDATVTSPSTGHGVWVQAGTTGLTLINRGRIESGSYAYMSGSISTLTNLGSITGTVGGLLNFGTIQTLNNRQGGSSPLHMPFLGLPANYNIIIDSPTVYGKLWAPMSSGSMTFGIHATSVVAPGTYEDVLSDVNGVYLANTAGVFNGFSWSLQFDGANYDLVLVSNGPNAPDTLTSMQSTAAGLRNAFAVQTAYLNPGLSYDCALFDSKGLCVAATGRNTSVQGSNAGATSGVVTLAWRVQPHWRVGGYVEQTIDSTGDPSVNVRKGNPDLGVFAVWNQRTDGDGLQARVAHRQGQKKVDITRPVVAGSEPGSGTAGLTSRGTQLTLSHGVRVNDTWRVSPYVGVRTIEIERGAYSEAASASVTAPLSYGALSERSVTLLLGTHVAARLAPRFTLTGFAGVEHDQSRKTSEYSATGVAALSPLDFNSNPKKTRPVASIGGIFEINETQQFSAQWVYRKEAFSSAATNSLLATYSVGF